MSGVKGDNIESTVFLLENLLLLLQWLSFYFTVIVDVYSLCLDSLSGFQSCHNFKKLLHYE